MPKIISRTRKPPHAKQELKPMVDIALDSIFAALVIPTNVKCERT